MTIGEHSDMSSLGRLKAALVHDRKPQIAELARRSHVVAFAMEGLATHMGNVVDAFSGKRSWVEQAASFLPYFSQMRRAARSTGALGMGAVLMLVGCASRMPEARPPEQRPPVKRRLPAEQPTRLVERGPVSLRVPDGYDDASADVTGANLVLVLVAKESSKGYQPTITIMKAPLPGGTFADPATCAETGRGFVTGGTEAPGIGGVLKAARVIDGPLGKACQIHLIAPRGVAIITELADQGNTPQTPREVWLMTCNHAEGDDVAEATCRAVLAGFRFRVR